MKNNQPTRAVLYARVSSEEQAGSDRFSITAQLNEMREYVARNNWVVEAEFLDEGISGEKWERPGLEALLEMVPEGGFEVLVVHELSRLSRSLYHTLEIFDLLGQNHKGFASVKDPDFNFADPTQRLFLTILAAVNQYYLDILRMHIRKSKRQRAKSGLYNASLVPFGYRMNGSPKDPPVIIPHEAEAIRLAFETYAAGRTSHKGIADLLNAEGFRARGKSSGKSSGKKGRRFSKANVSEMLKNPFYKGQVIYRVNGSGKTEKYPGLHEPIVSEELWESSQLARQQRRQGGRSVQAPYRVYLLSGIARCDICGRNLRCQASPSGVTYYREVSVERGYHDCPVAGLGTQTEPVDAYVDALIRAIRLPDAWLEEVASQMGNDGEIESLSRRRRELENRRRRLKEMRITGEFDEDRDLYETEMRRLKDELSGLPTYEDLEKLREMVSLLRDLPEIWVKANDADRRDLVRLMFRSVKVDVQNSRAVAFTPLPVFTPVFRQVEILHELRPGVFGAEWPQNQSERFEYVDTLVHNKQHTDISIQMEGLMFSVPDPFALPAGTRIAPGLSKALRMVREAGVRPEVITQVHARGVTPMPADLRKWPVARHQSLTMDADMKAYKPAHVIATRYVFLKAALGSDLADPFRLARDIYGSLLPEGVWYVQDILPAENLQILDQSASIYESPAALTLQKLMGELYSLGADIELKRSPYRLETAPEGRRSNGQAVNIPIVGTELWIRRKKEGKN